MADKQIIGEQKTLSSTPQDNVQKGFKGAQVQLTGEQVKLANAPVSQLPGKGVKSGERQIIGEQVKLNQTPQQGWNSAKTPVSKRAAAATRGGR
jgi:hypothetical protein